MEARNHESLEIGEIFERDLVDSRGRVLLESGNFVSAEFIQDLTDQGCAIVYLSKELSPISRYSSSHMAKLNELFEDSDDLLNAVTQKLNSGESIPIAEIDLPLEQCFESVRSDPCAVLATIMASKAQVDNIARRNMRLSSMAMVAAAEMGFSESDCKAIGRAGLLCDVALPEDFLHLDEMPPNSHAYGKALLRYEQHPILGAELLQEGVPGITQLELILVSQVHEQCDGSGFPRRLKKHQLHPLSRLLNLIDAFLTLTEEDRHGRSWVPADALAYMVLHSLYGAFDRDCMQALVAAAAIYPIGTRIVLDDNSTGVVVRSVGADYLDPVIQLDGSSEWIDLRKTQRQIVAPVSIEGAALRLPKSKLDDRLWVKVA